MFKKCDLQIVILNSFNLEVKYYLISSLGIDFGAMLTLAIIWSYDVKYSPSENSQN